MAIYTSTVKPSKNYSMKSREFVVLSTNSRDFIEDFLNGFTVLVYIAISVLIFLWHSEQGCLEPKALWI